MKSAVYSWRLAPAMKDDLEGEARRQGRSLAELLDQIAREWLEARQASRAQEHEAMEEARRRATRTFGTIAGADPKRSRRVRAAVRERLKARHAGHG
jgi:uncharacterized protein YyaL (SSP411 family)